MISEEVIMYSSLAARPPVTPVKQFFHEKNKDSVVCEWDYVTGKWICSPTPQGGKRKVTDIRSLSEELSTLGFRELLTRPS
jgi:hypothetical protein